VQSVLTERHESVNLPRDRGGVACGASWFVWTIWGAMLVAALAFVWQFGSDVPYWDEWEMVPSLTGDRPTDADWLWAARNGHRIPLPKLLLLAAYKLSGSDFRIGMYINVLALGAVAFVMIRVAKELRGRWSYADAFFPVALLNWGHCENFLWTWQLTQVTPVIIVCVLLIIVIRNGMHLSFGLAALAGLCLVMLPLCGVPGLVYVPALAIWLGFAGVVHWRSPERNGKRRALVIWGLISAALLLLAFYFVGYREPAHGLSALPSGISWTRVIAGSLRTSLQFLSGGFGPAAKSSWPYSGLVMLGLLLLTTGMLLRAATGLRSAEERSRAMALLLFMAATICLALSVGFGKRGHGFILRYFVQAAPPLCCVYFAWVAYGSRTARYLVPATLLSLIGLASPFNYETGLKYAVTYRENMQSFTDDLLAREPVSLLLARHAHSLCPCPWGGESTYGDVADDFTRGATGLMFPEKNCVSFHSWLGDFLRALHRVSIGDFRYLRPEVPPSREIPLPVRPTTAEQTAGEGLIMRGIRDDQNLIVDLSKPTFVYGIRVMYRGGLNADRSGKDPSLQVFWKRGEQDNFTRAQRYVLHLGSDEKTETIWIHGDIARIRINLENNFAYMNRLNLSLLIPVAR
jgi:hypothetical protein